MSITYNPINWQDEDSGGTSLDATNLNIMEQGIIDAVNAVNEVLNEIDDLETDVKQLESDYSDLNQSVNTKLKQVDFQIAHQAANTLSVDYAKADRINNSTSGHFLTVNDMGQLAFPTTLTLYGKATQGGTSGKNLLDTSGLTEQTIKGVTFTPVYDENGLLQYININGTATAQARYSVKTITLGTGSYTLNGCSGGSNTTYYIITAYIGSCYSGDKTGTLSAETSCNTSIIVESGATVNNIKIYPMLRLASISDSAYEPYTGGIASPNPDYPQEVTVAGADGQLVITSCGKNLFNKSEATSGMAVSRINGNELVGDNYANYSSSGYCAVVPDTTYYLGIAYTSNYYGLAFYDADKNFLSGMQASKSFTTPDGCYYVRFTWVTANYDIDTIQLEVGTVATPYERYRATTAIIPLTNGLAGIPVASGGNYTDENGQQWVCDTIEFENGLNVPDEGYYVQRIGKKVFDGSDDEEWTATALGNDTTIARYTSSSLMNVQKGYDNSTYAEALCTIAKPTTAYVGFEGNTLGFAVQSEGQLSFYVSKEKFPTLNVWLTYLSENPFEYYYQLAEPIKTSLTGKQDTALSGIHTFYPVTNLFTDDIGDVKMEYVADTKLYIDSKFNELATAILSAVGSEG